MMVSHVAPCAGLQWQTGRKENFGKCIKIFALMNVINQSDGPIAAAPITGKNYLTQRGIISLIGGQSGELVMSVSFQVVASQPRISALV